MGLCKCRTVTNLFCFQHRKNVCEKCIITDHPKCVVRSYLQWLQDSDYEPLCQLCKQPLDQGDLVRLPCLDLFHVNCINDACNALPNTTAPAGYACATCGSPILPADSATGPLAEIVRAKFADAKWAAHILPRRPLAPSSDPTLDEPAAGSSRPPPIVTAFDPANNGQGSANGGPNTAGIPETLPRKQQAAQQARNKDADDDKYGKDGRGEQGMLGSLLSELKPRRIGYRKMLVYSIIGLVGAGLVVGAMYRQNEED